jgi:hypothetical protein
MHPRAALCVAHAASAHQLKTRKEDEIKASPADKECAGGGE